MLLLKFLDNIDCMNRSVVIHKDKISYFKLHLLKKENILILIFSRNDVKPKNF